jgi:WhiB family redox-sensing transcriptional regulator
MMRCVTAAEGYQENWREFAACLSAEPELFFPAVSADLDDRQVERAKAVCKVCPVRRECLQFALATRQSYGVWGGMAERERRVARMPVPA